MDEMDILAAVIGQLVPVKSSNINSIFHLADTAVHSFSWRGSLHVRRRAAVDIRGSDGRGLEGGYFARAIKYVYPGEQIG